MAAATIEAQQKLIAEKDALIEQLKRENDSKTTVIEQLQSTIRSLRGEDASTDAADRAAEAAAAVGGAEAAAAVATAAAAGAAAAPEKDPLDTDSDEEAQPIDEEAVAALRAEGTEHFKKQAYADAAAAWMKAARMLELGHRPDAKMLSNIAAAQHALEKYVAASSYAGKSVAADPDWWKGHWYKAQSLMKMVRNKPPSTAMGERCEQAVKAFKQCGQCSTLPDAKRAEVEQEHQNAKNHLMQMTNVCNQS